MKPIYGLSSWLFDGLGVEEALAATAAAGFQLVELMGDLEHLESWPSDPARMRRALADAGVTVRTMHSPSAGWHNGDLDEAARKASIEAAAASFDYAAAAGVEVVVCHPNGTNTPYTLETFEANMALSRASMEVLAERARAAGVRMAVENLPARRLPRPGATVTDVLRLIDGLGDHVGICLDAGHSNSNGISAAEEALEAGSKLFSLHIQDNDGGGEDLHWVPGRGTTDWDAFLAALARMGFAGARILEVGAKEGRDETLAALARVRQAWEQREG